MNRLLQMTVIVALVSLCASALAQTLQGTLYKDQDCPCCEGHAKYSHEARNSTSTSSRSRTSPRSSKDAGIPGDYQGCHTLMLEG